MISSKAREVRANPSGERRPSRGRKVVRVLLNAGGLSAAIVGVYFTVDVVKAIIDLVRLARSEPPHGTAEAVAGTSRGVSTFLGGFDLLFIFVFGAIAVMCYLIAIWLLDPFQRWRDWRSDSASHMGY